MYIQSVTQTAHVEPANADAKPEIGVASNSSLLPETIAAGPLDAQQLAAFLATTSSEQRKAARKERAMEERAQEAAEKHQVSELREKAESAFRGAVIGASLKAAGGAAQIAGGVQEIRSAPYSAQAGALKLENNPANASAYMQNEDTAGRLGGQARVLDGAGGVLSAGGDFAKAFGDKAAGEHDANATEADNRAKRASRRADDAEDFAKEQNDFIDKVMSFYEAYTNAANGSKSAALLRG